MVRCDLHFWDADNTPQELTSPHTKGTSAVQFIITSNITIHTLNELRAAYVNVFSCKPFDEKVAEELTWRFFGAKSHHIRFIERD
jgi:S-adenosylmethionine/arginine decarboxylase-like enzyme